MNTFIIRTALKISAICMAGAIMLNILPAIGQTWPDRTIKLVVGSPPGASADFMARLVAERVGKSLGQQVVVENRPGAGGVLAVKSVVTSKADGYTLLLLYSDNMLVAPYLQKTQPYDPLKDLAYVGAVARSYNFILAVNPKLPVQTFDDYIKLAKSSPKRVSFSTYGLGSLPQLGFEIMSAKVGAELLHVPYKGGAESYQAAIAGDVDSVAGTSFTELLKSGRLRPLAIGGGKRSAMFPNIPTFAELGFGDQLFLGVTFGVAAPAGTPRSIIDRLAAELKAITQSPDVAERLPTVAAEPFFAGPDEMLSLIRTGVSIYAPLIGKLGLAAQ